MAASTIDTRRRTISWFHRRIANPLTRRMGRQTLLETTGRTSGLPRQTPVGGRVLDGSFWLVSDHGTRSDYVRNILADPHVRIRLAGRWHHAVAIPLPDDDPRARLRALPTLNSTAVRILGTELLTVRLDLQDETHPPST